MKIGYARVSTEHQDLTDQTTRLGDAGCEKIFSEIYSGKNADRPELRALLEFARPGDAIVITKLDRLGRSVRDLQDIADDLKARGIDLICLGQPIDTTTAAGKLFFTMLGAFAEFERDMISERTRDGLAAKKLAGQKLGGRARALDFDRARVAQQRILSGEKATEVAKALGVSRASLYRNLDHYGLSVAKAA